MARKRTRLKAEFKLEEVVALVNYAKLAHKERVQKEDDCRKYEDGWDKSSFTYEAWRDACNESERALLASYDAKAKWLKCNPDLDMNNTVGYNSKDRAMGNG